MKKQVTSERKYEQINKKQLSNIIALAAFTLAEVLITLTVIGIVSALVIPSVLKNYNDKKYNTARLKALKTFGEAGKLASINGEINGQPSAKDFVNNVLSKYLKITKVCDDNYNYQTHYHNALNCDFPRYIQPLNLNVDKIDAYRSNGTSWLDIGSISSKENNAGRGTRSVFVKTADGFSAQIFYNSKCARTTRDNIIYGPCSINECRTYVFDDTCMNVIYDMNGTKAPNQVGKDIGFVTVFWSGLKTSAAAPYMLPYEKSMEIYNQGEVNGFEAQELCVKYGYSLPSIDELSSLVINSNLSSIEQVFLWSGTNINSTSRWVLTQNGDRAPNNPSSATYTKHAWCVKR